MAEHPAGADEKQRCHQPVPIIPFGSTGAKTKDGLARISAANLRHGKFTEDKLEKRRENAAILVNWQCMRRQWVPELSTLETMIGQPIASLFPVLKCGED